MAIEPKIHIGYANEGRYSANKKFTDRIVYKDIFWNEINSIKSERSKNIYQYHILNFYGIGGIGKSSLQKELCHVIDVVIRILFIHVQILLIFLTILLLNFF